MASDISTHQVLLQGKKKSVERHKQLKQVDLAKQNITKYALQREFEAGYHRGGGVALHWALHCGHLKSVVKF